MADYINREALLKDIDETVVFTVRKGTPLPTAEMRGSNKVIDRIKSAPTADVVEVRHGEWMTREYQYGENGEIDKWVEKPAKYGDCAYCSLCLQHAGLNGGGEYVLSAYCPNCGAKMDGKDGAGE